MNGLSLKLAASSKVWRRQVRPFTAINSMTHRALGSKYPRYHREISSSVVYRYAVPKWDNVEERTRSISYELAGLLDRPAPLSVEEMKKLG